jgi:hypothetical protein
MHVGPSRRSLLGAAAIALAALAALGAGSARAAGPPILGAQWSSAVGSAAAKLSARIDPNGLNTTYHFEYLTEAAYQANGNTFAGALHAPASGEVSLSTTPLTVTQQIVGLAANTAYRYRVVAQNSDPASPLRGPAMRLTTKGPGPLLPDGRGWEMVSPVQKNGGQVDPPGTIGGGGVLQAAAGGGSVTYGSTASFEGGFGAPPASQYLSSRSSDGWSTENITAPIFSGTYDFADHGVPYQLFSEDLARSLLLNGEHCRSGGSGCAVANPPLPGSEAPEGYQDYYLRDDSSGGFEALLSSASAVDLDIGPAHFDLTLAGAAPDLRHVVLSSCAALSAGASEVPAGEGCDPAAQNLYEFSQGSGLALLNGATPGAALAASTGAISSSGERVYFTLGGDLYLHGASGNTQIDADAGGGGSFQAAATDGSIAFFTKSGHLWRYSAAGAHATDLTPGGGVLAVLGADASGDTAYFQDSGGLERWHGGVTTQVAAGASATDAGDHPPATGTARVSADGSELLFVSKAQLTGYDNTDLVTGEPDSEVYLYAAAGPTLTCVSCNPTNERPLGPSSIPGATANGTAPGSTDAYKPRVLSADGRRVFFDSADSLALTDTNSDHTTGAGIRDVYEWEAPGEGGCAQASGCVALISSGRSAGGALFVDASAEGSDAFFITDDSLVAADPGVLDLYDARVGGGFGVPSPPLACEGDACQALPSAPGDPTLTTLLAGAGNPPVKYHNLNKKKHAPKKHKHKRSRHGAHARVRSKR